MEKFKLYVDFDDCILRTGPNTDSKLYDSYNYASKKYFESELNKIKEEYQRQLDLIETKRIEINSKSNLSLDKKKEFLDQLYAQEMRAKTYYVRRLEILKEDEKYRYVNLDYVLEVLNNEGNGRNNYVNYTDLLNESGFIDDAKLFIQDMINNDNVDTSILSHCNSMDEALVKDKFVKENIGEMNVICLPFHSDEFKTYDRVNSSKAIRALGDAKIEKLDKSCILIDDNKNNIKDWNARGGRGILFSKKFVEGFPYQMNTMNLDSFLGCFNEEEKGIILSQNGKRI